MSQGSRDTTPRTSVGPIVAAVVAALVMIAIGGVYIASGLVAPSWAVVLLIGAWLVLAWYGVRLARSRSYVVLAIPLIAAGLWLLAVSLGDALLGWTA